MYIYIGGGPREIGDIGWFIYAYYVVTECKRTGHMDKKGKRR